MKIHPSLLSSLVTKQVWSPEKALAYAIQVPDKRHQAYAIAELIPLFEGYLLKDAFLSIPRELNEEVIKYISASILNIDDSNLREQIVDKISEYIPGDVVSDLKNKIKKLTSISEKRNSFKISSELLPAIFSQRLSFHFELRESANNIRKRAREWDDDYEVFNETIRQIDSGTINFDELDKASKSKKKKQFKSELNEILNLWDSNLRAYKLVKLAHRIPLDEKQRVIHEALKTIKVLNNEMDKAVLLSLLGGISSIPDNCIVEIMEIISAIQETAFKTHIFSALGHCFPIEYLEQEIKLISKSKDENFKAKVLSNLIPHLNKGLLYKILSIVSSINDADKRLYSLIYLQYNLDGQEQKNLADFILPLLESMENNPLKPKMEILSANLSGDIKNSNYINKLFQNIDKLSDEDKAECIKFLVPYLPEKLLIKALITGIVMPTEGAQKMVFESTIPLLKSEILESVVYSVIKNFDKGYPALLRSLSLISSFLPQKLQVMVQKFVFTEIFSRYITEDTDVDEPGKTAENSNLNSFYQFYGKSADDLLYKYQEEIYIDNDSLVTLAIIANGYPSAQEFLSKCEWVKSSYDLAVFFINIGLLQKESEREEIFRFVLDLSKQIKDEKKLSNVLALLVQHLPQNLLISCFETAITIEDDFSRFFILRIIDESISRFPKEILNSIFREGLFVMASRSRNSLLMDLGALNKTINFLEGSQGTSKICCAIQDVGRWWA